ncbi:hypothetical protein L6452_26749 [Arctium lappa]|uniref:Uncharacterized protein n=1 Tax=Arctium lappa TaxID=4217 RepID=A0ACB8ZWK8_ARCLA|nr:hypothetical protein L6452_26749 [Arctium lappa]
MESTNNSKKSLEMADSSNAFHVSSPSEHSKDQIASNGKSVEIADYSARIEDLKYLYASNVNVSNFVSEKLSGSRKYHVWKAQMVCLMESQKLHGIVDPKFDGPGAMHPVTIKQYDNLLKGWIFGSLSDDVLSTVVDIESARAVWIKLKSIYDSEKKSPEAEIQDVKDLHASNSKRNNSLQMADYSARMEELKFLYATNVNVSNFVSEKLSGDSNYHVWKEQMLCLMDSQKMLDMVQDKYDNQGVPMFWEVSRSVDTATNFKRLDQYESLLKGWILGSLNQDVLRTVVKLGSAREVWWKLKVIYDQQENSPKDSAFRKLSTLTEMKTTLVTETENGDNTDLNNKLFKAAVEGNWWAAEAILTKYANVATEAISKDGSTMLHLAVGKKKNGFVEELLAYIPHGKDIEKQNSDGRTALHIAAIVGNKYAAELLVKKRKELLGISDHKAYVPLLSAYYNMQLNTFVYLLEATQTKQQALPIGLYPGSGVRTGVHLLITAILTKEYARATSLVNTYPELATEDDQVLMAIIRSFPSELGFGEALMYPSWDNVCRKIVKSSSSLFFSSGFLYRSAKKDIFWAMRRFKRTRYSWLFPEIIMILIAIFYLIYQWIRLLILVFFSAFSGMYFLLWRVLATVVAPIIRIEKKKKDYKDVKKMVCFVCDQIDQRISSGTQHLIYGPVVLEAACRGAYEVVDEILSRSPKVIDYVNRNGHNIIQLAVINRSEKVYNLILQIVERTDLSIMDSSENTILHLAGSLAPSPVLSRTTGAALQLQQELQWCKEVEKFMSPTELIKENIHRETPEMVFTREHKDLMKEGEKWMKTTAESCSITAALITTIVFAAAITVPGGSNQETGIPLFRKEIAFNIFAVADAISLFTSSTALLVFLSILTARFSEQDFVVSLPRRLIIGLFSLFLSTTAMMVAFSAILFLVFCDQRAWMLVPIGGLACLSIAVIVTLQFPLVIDLIVSTYRPIFGKQSYIDRCKSIPKNMRHLSKIGNEGWFPAGGHNAQDMDWGKYWGPKKMARDAIPTRNRHEINVFE